MAWNKVGLSSKAKSNNWHLLSVKIFCAIRASWKSQYWLEEEGNFCGGDISDQGINICIAQYYDTKLYQNKKASWLSIPCVVGDSCSLIFVTI